MTQNLDSTFSALADPTRRAILAALVQRREMSVGEIAEPFGISLPAVSRHLDVLESARLLVRSKQGRSVLCRPTPAPMEAAMRWLANYEKFWTQRLDALAVLSEETPWTNPKTSGSPSSTPSKPRRKKFSRPEPNQKR